MTTSPPQSSPELQQQHNGLHSPLPPLGGPPPLSQTQDSHPNRTLYVNNLNSKIKTDKLKKELTAIFENFGEVRDTIAMKSFWRRGQAWVIFRSQEAADKAIAALQGFPYQGKEMRIQYAREISDVFAKEEGTFVERPPGPKKPRAIVERERRLQAQLQQFQQMMQQHLAQMTAAAAQAQQDSIVGRSMPQMGMGLPALPATQPPPPQFGIPSTSITQDSNRTASVRPPVQMTKEETVVAAAKAAAAAVEAAAKKRAAEAAAHQVTKMARLNSMASPPSLGGGFESRPTSGRFSSQCPVPPPAIGFFNNQAPAMRPSTPTAASPSFTSAFPNQTLFVENLPEDCSTAKLQSVFHQYPGCQDIRHIAAKRVAFIDYASIPQASVALRALQNFSLQDGFPLRLSYAK